MLDKQEQHRINSRNYYRSLTPEEKRIRNSSPSTIVAKAKYRSNEENREKERAYCRKWYQENKRKKNTRNRVVMYGLSVEEFEKMKTEQNGLCKLCGDIPVPSKNQVYGRFHIDHCHKSGTVRGLLCGNCNKGLGNFSDSPRKLQKAIDYLKQGNYNADV